MKKEACTFMLLLCSTFTPPLPSHANESKEHTPTLTGFLGLNTIPSARMDNEGTLRLGAATLDPYAHGYIGIQIAKPLYINIRQTAEVSDLRDDAKRLYPGIDFKLRLKEETPYLPAISLGIQSALGHKRMSGEFLTLSKRYHDFDITMGMGWGRYATAKHLKNPLRNISNHFKDQRTFNNEEPNTPANWFTGEHIGIFGGVEYFTPLNGLSLKLDYGSDRYTAEQQTFGYNPPSPWGFGLSYSPTDWINAGLGLQGTDKIMGRLSIQSSPAKWTLTGKKYDTPLQFYKTRSETLSIEKIRLSAQKENLKLGEITAKQHNIHTTLDIPPYTNAPQHIGRAVRHIATYSGPDIETISITPKYDNLLGKTIKILRSDVEKALDNNQGSPQEIWKNIEFITTDTGNIAHSPFIPKKGIEIDAPLATLHLENQISLSEEDNGTLYRSSAILKTKDVNFLGLITASSLRLNLHDNLDNIDNLRAPAFRPIRSDVNAFTRQRLSIDTAYIGYNLSLNPSTHIALSAGYLEEFHSGFGGEILYRPHDARYAIGAEIWRVQRRQPYTTLNLGHNGYGTVTGHINAWYDIPEQDITINAKIGRYLAGDSGFSIDLDKRFENGAKLTGELTLTNAADPDLFGGTTHAYHRLGLTLPLGSIKYIPEGSTLRTIIAPFGRDTGQSLNKPQNLYDMTENFTIDHMAQHWTKILN